MPLLVGRTAPDFVAPAVLANGSISERYHLRTAIRGRYALLFFNPWALTIVCASELTALDRRIKEFHRHGVVVLGVTLDSQCRHSIWRNIPVDRLPRLRYSLVVDVDQRICRAYGLQTLDGSCAFRGAFIIDRAGIVRYQAINDLPLRRELDDLLTMVNALQTAEAAAQACPTGRHAARDQLMADTG